MPVNGSFAPGAAIPGGQLLLRWISKPDGLLNYAPKGMHYLAAGGAAVAFRPPSSDLARSRRQP